MSETNLESHQEEMMTEMDLEIWEQAAKKGMEANPRIVLELIAEIRKLKKEVERLRGTVKEGYLWRIGFCANAT